MSICGSCPASEVIMSSTGKERFLSALQRDVPDRVPVFLRDLTLCLDQTGYSTPEVCAPYNAVKASRSISALQSRLHQDAVVGCVHHVGLEIELLGGAVQYPPQGIPSITQHPFQDVIDPSFYHPDMRRDKPYPQILECYGRVSASLEEETAVVCNLEGPLTKAALLRGLENLILDLELEPALGEQYVRYATELGEDYVKTIGETSTVDAFFVASASDNPDLFGLQNVLGLTLPGLGALRKTSRKLGLPMAFHPHGDLSDSRNATYLEGIIKTGVEAIQFAERNDASALKNQVGSKVALMGGIDAFSTLLLGPSEKIIEESNEYLRLFRPYNGYVFMCSCSLHRGMPLDNVELLMHHLREPHQS